MHGATHIKIKKKNSLYYYNLCARLNILLLKTVFNSRLEIIIRRELSI
jgi:hypothetical protein